MSIDLVVWTPGAVFSIGWLVFFMPIGITLVIWFWLRKHLQPIKARQPSLVLLTDFLLLVYIFILCLQRIAGESYPCLLNIWSSYLGVLILFNTYIWRCWSLYYLYHQTQQLLNNAGRDAKDRHFDYPLTIRLAQRYCKHPNSTKVMVRFVTIMTLVLVFPCAILTIEHSELRTQTGDTCDFDWGFDLVAAYVVLYTLVFSWFAWNLRSVIDGFQIKEELKASGILAILTLIPWWLFNTQFDRINTEVFPFSTLFLIMGCCVALFISTGMPLWYSIWGRPVLEDITPPDDLSTLHGVLSFPEGIEAMQAFLTKEFSVENILFYLEIEDFRKAQVRLEEENRHREVLELAQGIWKKYIAPDAVYQVNLPSQAVADLKVALRQAEKSIRAAEPDGPFPSMEELAPDWNRNAHIANFGSYGRPEVQTIFDAAQKNTHALMETDSFPRFTRSKEYRELVAIVEEKLNTQKVLLDQGVI